MSTPACDGSGGYVYTYEGPQFGAQIIEEPCEKCGGWHQRHTAETEASTPRKRPSWLTRLRRRISS